VKGVVLGEDARLWVDGGERLRGPHLEAGKLDADTYLRTRLRLGDCMLDVGIVVNV
jgi:hypothetical protein